MKIDKKLVIDYQDIITGKNPDCPTYNNMDFYLHSAERLRYKLNEVEEHNNKFFNCFNTKTLEILKPLEWQELSLMSLEAMCELVETNEWDWLGEDFMDMQEYLYFIEDHEPNVAFTTHISDDDEYMDIFFHDTSKYVGKEKAIFTEGLRLGKTISR